MIFLIFWPAPLRMLPWAMIPLAGLLKLALITKNRKPIRFSTSGLMVLSVVNLLAFVWYW